MEEVIIPISISANVLWILVGIAVLVFMIISAIYIFHWQYYGIKGNHRVFAKSLYFIVGVALLFLMIIFLGGYAYA